MKEYHTTARLFKTNQRGYLKTSFRRAVHEVDIAGGAQNMDSAGGRQRAWGQRDPSPQVGGCSPQQKGGEWLKIRKNPMSQPREVCPLHREKISQYIATKAGSTYTHHTSILSHAVPLLAVPAAASDREAMAMRSSNGSAALEGAAGVKVTVVGVSSESPKKSTAGEDKAAAGVLCWGRLSLVSLAIPGARGGGRRLLVLLPLSGGRSSGTLRGALTGAGARAGQLSPVEWAGCGSVDPLVDWITSPNISTGSAVAEGAGDACECIKFKTLSSPGACPPPVPHISNAGGAAADGFDMSNQSPPVEGRGGLASTPPAPPPAETSLHSESSRLLPSEKREALVFMSV